MSAQLKLKFYYDHILSTVYPEGDSAFHQGVTKDVVERFIKPLDLDKSIRILDLGCGPGYFLDEMTALGFTQLEGITLSKDDVEICQRKGHKIRHADMNFLADKDESVDMLFCRHSLEHSPFPYISLLEYNRVLKPNGVLYIEVPAPDCDQPHEENRNHYSILPKKMWGNLIKRAGFDAEWYEYELPITFTDHRADQGTQIEHYYIFLCRRRRSADIK